MIDYFNTHSHLQYVDEEKELRRMLQNCQDKNVSWILNAAIERTDSKNFVLKNRDLINEYSINVFYSVGLHPCYCEIPYTNIEDDLEGAIAIGETGFDFYHEKNPTIEQQIQNFYYHKQASLKHKKPMIIHSRNAESITIEQLKQGTPRFLIHCFTGTKEFAQNVLDLGGFISFSGIITYKSAASIRDVIAYCPNDRILIETDDPYLVPKSLQSKFKKNEPSHVIEIFDMIVETKKEDKNVLRQTIFNNSKKFFNL